MQATLILAAIYNVIGGFTILFFLSLVAPVIHFSDSGPGLFRMFVGGTDAVNWPVLRCPRLAGFEVSPEAGR